jgi:short subunit dehydrogenase-like uncharacterized protein
MSDKHLSTQFDAELAGISNRVLEMGGLVESQVAQSIYALTQFSGETAAGQTLAAVVRGDRDPGYGSTCKLISESALCLLQQVDRGMTGGGIWTPGAAMGLLLVRRLHERAGLRFAIEQPAAA